MPLPSPFTTPQIQLVETRLVPRPSTSSRISCARDAAVVFAGLVGHADRENFAVLYLDARHRITHAHLVSIGSAQGALVHPREVFKGAFLANAAAIIVGHNHPSGDVQASAEDRAITERLNAAGELLGVTLLDSLIVGPSAEFFSSSEGAVSRLPSPAVDDERYSCPECRSLDVELCFPVWVLANDIDDRNRWELDVEAQPEKDGDKGWCPSCESNVLVRREG
jgi:DNA repair protein RadC